LDWSKRGIKIGLKKRLQNQCSFATILSFQNEVLVGDSRIFRIDSDGSNRRQLTFDHGSSPTWSPDSKRIAFISWDANERSQIFVMDANGNKRQQLTTRGGCSAPDWSHKGKQIVFESQYNIFVIDSDGKNLRQLSFERTDFDPVWSPDGKRIAFGAKGGGRSHDIWVMNADGSNRRQLTFNDSSFGPDW
jgi:TolB protein